MQAWLFPSKELHSSRIVQVRKAGSPIVRNNNRLDRSRASKTHRAGSSLESHRVAKVSKAASQLSKVSKVASQLGTSSLSNRGSSPEVNR